MASRFTDTEIWNEDWFCEMPGEYQLFVKYVFDTCDNAGVWKPKKFDFETKTKFKVSLDLLFKKMNGGGQHRVLLLDNGRWFITGYILFQWFNKKKSFDLVLSNRLHKSLLGILLENKIDLLKVRGLREVLKGPMVMVMEEAELRGKGGSGEKEIPLSPEGFFSDAVDKAAVLTDQEIDNSIEYLRLTCKKVLDRRDIVERFEAFKIRQFALHEWYNSWEKLLNHFRDSLKLELKNGTTTHQRISPEGGAKSGTSTTRTAGIKGWTIGAGE